MDEPPLKNQKAVNIGCGLGMLLYFGVMLAGGPEPWLSIVVFGGLGGFLLTCYWDDLRRAYLRVRKSILDRRGDGWGS